MERSRKEEQKNRQHPVAAWEIVAIQGKNPHLAGQDAVLELHWALKSASQNVPSRKE
jgi:hypothetical protein